MKARHTGKAPAMLCDDCAAALEGPPVGFAGGGLKHDEADGREQSTRTFVFETMFVFVVGVHQRCEGFPR